ncbi:hypothetical protein ABG768_017712 [Culter alburnus]|uniref:Ubiquitin-like domain-containing protein n=1 Tax=Culter alburnus TaxID=194366 RepID=A0AAW1YTT5_CULAL
MSFQIYFRDWGHQRSDVKVCVSSSEEELRNTTVEELKRKLIPEDQHDNTILLYQHETLKKNRTLGSYGIKHRDEIRAVRRGKTRTFEDDDDDEGKEISRTQSLEYLALMQQPEPPVM